MDSDRRLRSWANTIMGILLCYWFRLEIGEFIYALVPNGLHWSLSLSLGLLIQLGVIVSLQILLNVIWAICAVVVG